jgi:hypothetical protein
MIKVNTLKHVFLALGLSGALAACGDSNPTPTTITYSANIKADITSLCALSGCHNSTAPQMFKFDPAADAMTSYNALLALMVSGAPVVVKGNAATSLLITKPSTGGTTSHVIKLTGQKLTDWTNWVNMQAPF